MLYFAYGSNMWRARIEERLGPCRPVATARLEGRALRFHKAGGDGSGKCDAFLTGAGGDVLYGVVYEITAAQRRLLDRFEGPGYAASRLAVQSRAGVLDAFAYVAHETVLDPGARPFDWYKALVLEGARRARLPHAYIDRIRAVDAIPDPDPERATRHRALLSEAVAPGSGFRFAQPTPRSYEEP